MQGRAVAVYGLVLVLVAAGAFAYQSTAEAPEPSLDDPEHVLEVGETFEVDDRTYNLTGFDSQQGDPTALLEWTDETARSSESWTHAEDPGGTTVEYEGGEYWVRIPQTADPSAFTLLESPGDDADFSVFTSDSGNWIVNDSGEYVDLQDFDRLERVQIDNGSMLTVGAEDDAREVRVDSVTNESVTVSWQDPFVTEVVVRQASRKDLNGVNHTVHIPGDGTAEFTSDEAAIEDYRGQHQDKADFQTRMDGLLMTTVLALITVVLLVGLAFLPRKE